MAEDEGADRTGDEADEIDAERAQRRGVGIFVGEEQLAENEAGHGAVEEKIVPLDRGSDRRRDDGTAKLAVMLVGRECIIDVSHRYHWHFLPGYLFISKLAFPFFSAARAAFADDHPLFGRACQGDTMTGSLEGLGCAHMRRG